MLQERIAQLQQENSALVQLSRGDECGEDGGVDIQGLVEKIVKLKTRLKSVYEKGHTSVDVEGGGMWRMWKGRSQCLDCFIQIANIQSIFSQNKANCAKIFQMCHLYFLIISNLLVHQLRIVRNLDC